MDFKSVLTNSAEKYTYKCNDKYITIILARVKPPVNAPKNPGRRYPVNRATNAQRNAGNA